MIIPLCLNLLSLFGTLQFEYYFFIIFIIFHKQKIIIKKLKKKICFKIIRQTTPKITNELGNLANQLFNIAQSVFVDGFFYYYYYYCYFIYLFFFLWIKNISLIFQNFCVYFLSFLFLIFIYFYFYLFIYLFCFVVKNITFIFSVLAVSLLFSPGFFFFLISFSLQKCCVRVSSAIVGQIFLKFGGWVGTEVKNSTIWFLCGRGLWLLGHTHFSKNSNNVISQKLNEVGIWNLAYG